MGFAVKTILVSRSNSPGLIKKPIALGSQRTGKNLLPGKRSIVVLMEHIVFRHVVVAVREIAVPWMYDPLTSFDRKWEMHKDTLSIW